MRPYYAEKAIFFASKHILRVNIREVNASL